MWDLYVRGKNLLTFLNDIAMHISGIVQAEILPCNLQSVLDWLVKMWVL